MHQLLSLNFKRAGQFKILQSVDLSGVARYTHVGQNSDLIYNHHYNWRMKALEKIQKKDPQSLLYSALFSLSKENALKLKNNFLELIKNHAEILKPSKEEVLYFQVIDFFEI